MERKKSIHVWLYTILIVGIIAAVIWVLPQRKMQKHLKSPQKTNTTERSTSLSVMLTI